MVDDINSNRHRVQSILTRLHDAQDARNISNNLEPLVREEVLSHGQYQKLVELEELDLPTVLEIIKETKIGEGLQFLPKTIGPLKKMLQSLLEELTEKENLIVRSGLSAVLEELHQQ